MAKGYKRATTAQTVDVAQLIKQNSASHILGVLYNKGWSDASVAALAGCSVSSVERIRRELYGPLYKPLFEKVEDAERMTLEDFASRIIDLEAGMYAILKSHNKLLDEFGKLPLELNF